VRRRAEPRGGGRGGGGGVRRVGHGREIGRQKARVVRQGQRRGRVAGREAVGRRMVFGGGGCGRGGRVRVVPVGRGGGGGGGRGGRAERRRRIRTLQKRQRGRRVGGVRAQVLEQLVGRAEPFAAVRRQVGAHPRAHVRQLAGGRGQRGELSVRVRRGHRVVVLLLVLVVRRHCRRVMVVSGGDVCGRRFGSTRRGVVALRTTGRARGGGRWRNRGRLLRFTAGGLKVSGQLAPAAVRVAARQRRRYGGGGGGGAGAEMGTHQRRAQRRHVMVVRRHVRQVVRGRVVR